MTKHEDKIEKINIKKTDNRATDNRKTEIESMLKNDYDPQEFLKMAKNLSNQEIDKIKQDLEQTSEYQNYINQRIQFNTLDSILDDLNKQTGAKNDEKIIEAKRRINEFIHEVKRDVFSYHVAIRRIQNMRINKFRMDDREYVEELQERDHSRRRIHNSLLSNLTILSRYCSKNLFQDFKIKIPPQKLFTSQELNDRDFIGEWAYGTAIGETVLGILRDLESAKNKTTEQNGPAPSNL